MVWAIVKHVAALAEALEVAQPVIARVMIEVCCCQYHAGWPDKCRFLEIGPPRRSTPPSTPRMAGGIEPTSIGQTATCHSMWPAAPLAKAVRALEAYAPADLRPVSGIEPPHLRLDWHSHPLCVASS